MWESTSSKQANILQIIQIFKHFSVGGEDVQRRNIKRIIRHAHTYRSYGYASYGGYDISLLELETPIRGFKFICLPRPSFDDITPGGTLAGYGLYLRNEGETCQTNEFGRFKGGSHHGIFHLRPFPERPSPKTNMLSSVNDLPVSLTTAIEKDKIFADRGSLPEILSANISTKTTRRV